DLDVLDERLTRHVPLQRNHVQVPVEGAARVLPGKGRDRREVRIILDGIAGEVRREVGALGLEEGGQVSGATSAATDVDVESAREQHHVRQVVSCHDGRQLRCVVRRLDDV